MDEDFLLDVFGLIANLFYLLTPSPGWTDFWNGCLNGWERVKDGTRSLLRR